MTMRASIAGVIWTGCLAALAGSQTPDVVSIYVDDPSFSSGARSDAYQLAVDGVSVPIARVVAGPHPVSAVVLLDASSSAAIVSASDAARRLAGAARDGDAIRIGTFAKKILLSRPFGHSEASAAAAAREVNQRDGPSPLWDAIYTSVNAVAGFTGVRAVLVFTDAMSTGNDHAFSDVEGLVATSGVIVSAVGVGDDALRFGSTMRAVGRNGALRRLADGSGGLYYELQKRSESPIYRLAGMLDQMRKQYRIDFVPPVRDGAVHRVSVTRAGRPVRAATHIRY